MSKTLRAHLALLSANLIYGGNYTIAKAVMPGYIQPFGFILIRVSGALLLYWLVSSMMSKEKVERKDIPYLMMLALFGVAINQMLFFKGLNITTPINASIIMICNPIVVVIFAAILLKERIAMNKIWGIALGIAGAATLLLFKKGFAFGSNTLDGDTLVLINSMSWAAYLVLAKPMMQKYKAITVVKWVFLFGFLYVLPFGYSEFTKVSWSTMPTSIWMCVAYVVIATTFVAYLLNTYALNELSPSVVSSYIYLQPVFATIIAIIAGYDHLNGIKIVSGMLIIAGVYLVSKRKKLLLQKK